MMKKLFTLLLAVTPFLVFSMAAGNWETGGNDAFNPNPVNTGNNYLGTSAGTNIPLRIGTNGTTRLLVNNGTNANNAGRIAMGNNLPVGFQPQDRLHLHFS